MTVTSSILRTYTEGLDRFAIVFENPSLAAVQFAYAVISSAPTPLAEILNKLGLGGLFAFSVMDDEANISNWEWSTFPVANRQIASNAGILQPNTIKIQMHLDEMTLDKSSLLGYAMLFLKNFLDVYVANGGTFTVITPHMVYTSCLLKSFSAEQQKTYPGQTYRWEFFQPIISINGNTVLEKRIRQLESGGIGV